MAASKKKAPSYAEASAELDTILAEIETGDADIDVLAERVERAAELIRLCRSKLSETEMKVKKVVEELDSEPPEGEARAED